MKTAFILFACLTLGVWMTGLSCSPSEPNALDKLSTVELTIGGQRFLLWVADDPMEQERGLMFVTAEEMAPLPDGAQRGMIFVFPRERYLSFWMKNTIIPLDIAYIDTTGEIVSIHTMAPLDTRPGRYNSGRPARFALEVNADVFSALGLQAGDRIDIPDSLLKPSP